MTITEIIGVILLIVAAPFVVFYAWVYIMALLIIAADWLGQFLTWIEVRYGRGL